MDTTQHTPADVRERVARECVEEAERLRYWYGEWYARAQRLLREAAALLRTPRGEGEAMDTDAMWYHWYSGHEDAALQGLRTATDDEAHRFLSMLADWQRCPKPSDHDAIAALRSEASGQGGIHPDPETWRCRQCGGYAAHYRDCPSLRSEAPGEESVLSAARLFVQQVRAAGEDRFSDFGVFSAYEGLANAVDATHPTERSESDEQA